LTINEEINACPLDTLLALSEEVVKEFAYDAVVLSSCELDRYPAVPRPTTVLVSCELK
jgi:hypothetical protein